MHTVPIIRNAKLHEQREQAEVLGLSPGHEQPLRPILFGKQACP